jgi:hypothetical protein
MTTSYLDGNSVNGRIHEIGHSFGGEHWMEGIGIINLNLG